MQRAFESAEAVCARVSRKINKMRLMYRITKSNYRLSLGTVCGPFFPPPVSALGTVGGHPDDDTTQPEFNQFRCPRIQGVDCHLRHTVSEMLLSVEIYLTT
ncbi:hypothetical protein EVAR_95079_1 [Eumeta japonica]|uniref:Uncharacterized protein n=1 Tax=Eumeta variegata TaxID=151549 RepID=A0A4C1W918_EUMVA|nr:hypothetical protein EVAR_95079_1 [Eumeta japonica]